MEDAFGKRETLTVTHNHPYLRAANDNSPGILNAVKLDPGGDWSAAGLLKPGDRVQSAIGAHVEVVSVEPVEGLTPQVYNLEVADHHTYAVGELEAWAHNATFPRNPKKMDDILGICGINMPDAPSTPGRRKCVWTLPCGCEIVYEAHPYDKGYESVLHKNPHWEVRCPGKKKRKYIPGRKIPDWLLK